MACWRSGFCALRAACFALVSALACVALPSGARAADTLYDVAKVSVDATDKDAVAAKAKGMKAAELDALNVVLKRLMPVSAYAQLPDLSQQDVEELVSSVSIRSEQNSATRYIASLDVSFNSEAVKQLLDSQNIPYSEARAEAISILPLVLDGGTVKSDGAWPQAWEDLDLAHSATPATILKPRPDLMAETVKSVLGGDAQAFALMQADYSYAPLVIAVGEAGDGGKFVTRLVGADSVGPINYGHTDSFNGNAKEVARQAAAVAFGIIENRWKVTQTPAPAEAPPAGSEGRAEQAPQTGAAEVPRNVQAMVQFTGLKDWQEIRARLMQVAGIQALEVNALSARAASITFDYAGSLGKLQTDLSQSGFAFDEKDGTFVLRSK